MGLFGKIQSGVDSLTGHKSTHYTRKQVIDSEMAKASEAAKRKGLGGSEPEVDDEPDLAPDRYGVKAAYAPQEHGLNDFEKMYQNDQESKAAVARAAMQRTADMANQDIQSQQMAADTRIGGKYTDQGMQLADKNATLNAQDRLRAKAMIGIGGVPINPYGPQGMGYRMKRF